MAKPRRTRNPAHPPTPADRILEPFLRFAAVEASAGILLFVFAVAALIWANSPVGSTHAEFFGNYLTVAFAGAEIHKPLVLWVNDGLMALFFLVVGCEIKRELLIGELSSVRKATLPVFAAIGGGAIPALVYYGFNAGGPGASGWGIPMATDIAFALAVATALGPRVPMSLKVFLTAVAIVDDLAAVMVIALFYTAEVSTTALGVAGAAFVLLVGLNRAGFRSFLPYGVIGAVLWVAVLKSGVHATVAGVLIAMTIPASRLEGEYESPLEVLEHALHPWAAYLILPIFALANAGVVFGGESSPETTAITLGIIAGLVVGKPIGVFVFSWLAVRLGVADLPEGARWGHVLGAGLLCGIGFTMSLFIGGLAFSEPEQLNAAKIGILAASLAAGCAGALLLATVGGRAEEG